MILDITVLMYFNDFMTIKGKGNNNLSQVHVQSVLNNVDKKLCMQYARV